MSNCTTRVELHGGNEKDYERLHQAMEAEGFSRKIQASDGTWYHLPTAEYHYSGQLSTEQVYSAADRAADRTGKAHAVLVTEAKGYMWEGLPKVR